MRTSDFRHWWVDFLMAAILLSLIFLFDYDVIIAISKRSSHGSGISALLRSIHLFGGKTLVYGFLGILSSLFFANGIRKFIREWRADEVKTNQEKYSPTSLIKQYHTICDVLLAKGFDEAYNKLLELNQGKGSIEWIKKVNETLEQLHIEQPDAYKSIQKWTEAFKNYPA